MNILVVDDHPLVHEILGALLRKLFGDTKILAAESLAEGLAMAGDPEGVDLVLLDLGLPDCAGLETLERFRAAHPRLRVVVFSATDDPGSVVRALDAGAAGYLPKTSRPAVIAAALRQVAAGGIYVPAEAGGSDSVPNAQGRDIALTDRQADVLRLILRGLANKEIAKRLRIAEDTVKQHARGAYAVLGVGSRTQAILAVTQRGIRLD